MGLLDDRQLDSGALGRRILADPLVTSTLVGKAPAVNITKAGRWVAGEHGTRTTFSPGEGYAAGQWFFVDKSISLDRIGVEITTPGSAGALIRLGIYKLDTATADAALVGDYGTIDGTQAAGVYAITISQALTAGVYMLTTANQGAPVTKATMRGTGGPGAANRLFNQSSQANIMGATPYAGWYDTAAGVTGALPATLTTVAALNPTTTMIAVRMA